MMTESLFLAVVVGLRLFRDSSGCVFPSHSSRSWNSDLVKVKQYFETFCCVCVCLLHFSPQKGFWLFSCSLSQVQYVGNITNE